jgi:hypothetical protein
MVAVVNRKMPLTLEGGRSELARAEGLGHTDNCPRSIDQMKEEVERGTRKGRREMRGSEEQGIPLLEI